MATFAELLNPVHSPEKQKILDIIATSGPKLVPVEVASKTGLALPIVVSELNNIASETNAHLEVTESGNIAYLFANNLQQVYAANASRHVWQAAMRVISNVSLIVMRAFCALMFFLVRISFGLFLILGAVFIVVLIIVVIVGGLKALSGGDGDSGGGDSNFDFDFGSLLDFGWNSGYSSRPFWAYWAFDWLWDWFFYWRYVIPGPVYYENNAPYSAQNEYYQQQQRKEAKPNFLMGVFSYLFGDGDPNSGLEERKWQTVASVIGANQGVVTAEQLAPYTGEDPAKEDWMVHVLQRFNGSPEVSEKGNIIYVFPAFQTNIKGALPSTPMGSLQSATDFTGKQADDDLSNLFRQHVTRQRAAKTGEQKLRKIEDYLAEEEWPFMPVEGGTLTSIFCFGLFVLVGSIFVLLNMHLAPVLYLLSPLIWGIFAYGLLFFVVPGVRYVIYQSINSGIAKRNDAKGAFARALRNPSAPLVEKLTEAKAIRISGLPRGSDQTVYTTEKDALDQPDDLDKQFEP